MFCGRDEFLHECDELGVVVFAVGVVEAGGTQVGVAVPLGGADAGLGAGGAGGGGDVLAFLDEEGGDVAAAVGEGGEGHGFGGFGGAEVWCGGGEGGEREEEGGG